jgi:hypothetical protein
MADVITKAVPANNYNNGGLLVSNGGIDLITDNSKIDPKVNKVDQINVQSGVLDSRFDDVRYYTGDIA